jgi:hypothetical integral membrane protein (TIGR02206 family)
MALAAGVAVWAPRRHSGRWIVPAARTLALVIFAGWAGEYLADVVRGTWTTQYDLPLQLTDAVSVVAILALLSRRVLLVELVYFWSLTASLQAVLTPDLSWNFPSVYYFTYFIYHVGAIVAACFLVLGCRIYPRPGAVWRVYAATLGFAAIAAVGDIATGGNYMYLRAKPGDNSLLSLMGPWPVYIVATGVLALVMLFVVSALTDWVRRRDRSCRGGANGATSH